MYISQNVLAVIIELEVALEYTQNMKETGACNPTTQ